MPNTRSQKRQLTSYTRRSSNRSGIKKSRNRSGIKKSNIPKQTSSKQIKIDPFVYEYKIKEIIACYHTNKKNINNRIIDELNHNFFSNLNNPRSVTLNKIKKHFSNKITRVADHLLNRTSIEKNYVYVVELTDGGGIMELSDAVIKRGIKVEVVDLETFRNDVINSREIGLTMDIASNEPIKLRVPPIFIDESYNANYLIEPNSDVLTNWHNTLLKQIKEVECNDTNTDYIKCNFIKDIKNNFTDSKVSVIDLNISYQYLKEQNSSYTLSSEITKCPDEIFKKIIGTDNVDPLHIPKTYGNDIRTLQNIFSSDPPPLGEIIKTDIGSMRSSSGIGSSILNSQGPDMKALGFTIEGEKYLQQIKKTFYDINKDKNYYNILKDVSPTVKLVSLDNNNKFKYLAICYITNLIVSGVSGHSSYYDKEKVYNPRSTQIVQDMSIEREHIAHSKQQFIFGFSQSKNYTNYFDELWSKVNDNEYKSIVKERLGLFRASTYDISCRLANQWKINQTIISFHITPNGDNDIHIETKYEKDLMDSILNII